MLYRVAVLVFLAGMIPAQAEKLNGVDIEKAKLDIECLQFQFEHAGFTQVAFLEDEYFVKFTVKNATDQPCALEPYTFRFVDSAGKEFDVMKVRITLVEEGQPEPLNPGDSKTFAIVFGDVTLNDKPARLYYKGKMIGEITK